MGETRQSISKFAVEVDPIENRLAYWFSIRQTFIKIVILINVIKNKHNCSCIYEATFYLKSRSGTEGICKEQDSLMRLCVVCYCLRFFGRTRHSTRFCLIKTLLGLFVPEPSSGTNSTEFCTNTKDTLNVFCWIYMLSFLKWEFFPVSHKK